MTVTDIYHKIGEELNIYASITSLDKKLVWVTVYLSGVAVLTITNENSVFDIHPEINMIRIVVDDVLDSLSPGSYTYQVKVLTQSTGSLDVVQSGSLVLFSDTYIGNVAAGSYVSVSSTDGQLRFVGEATAYDDLRIDGLSTRVGSIQPTDETGFRGNSNFFSRNFVHTQADEVQFHVQTPHTWIEGGYLAPHVHFSPWVTNTGPAAVRFVFEFYWQNVNGTFPESPIQYTVTSTWTDNKQWAHLIAGDAENPLDATGWKISTVAAARLYRDNTVPNNLAGKVSLLYIDFHVGVNSFGSALQFIKDR